MEADREGAKRPIDQEDEGLVNDDLFRYNRLLKLEAEMKEEQKKYEVVLKKYKKAHRICTTVDVACNFIGLSCATSSVAGALSAVGLPVAIPLAVIGGISYVLGMGSIVVNKKIASKLQKHRAISELARSTCKSLSRLHSQVIEDGKVDHKEYDMICDVVENYYKQKKELQRRKVHIKKALQKEFKRGEEAMRNKFVAGMNNVGDKK